MSKFTSWAKDRARGYEPPTLSGTPVSQVVEAAQPNGGKVADTGATPAWPATLKEEAFHGLAGEIVRAIEPHSEADPAALLLQFLVAFGSVIGRTAHFVAEADRHFLNLFLVLVGVSSKGRKGTAWGHVRRLAESVDPTWTPRVKSGLSSGEGLIWAVRDPIEGTEPVKEKGKPTHYEQVVKDEGVSDKRLHAHEPEFAGTLRVLGRDGNTLSPLMRNAWDKGDLESLTKNSPAKATGAHISIVGHVTKPELLRYLDSTEAGNGFGNRFLWACVRRSKSLPEGGNLHEVDFAPLLKRLREAVEFARGVGEMRRDEEARALWREVYPALSEGKLGLTGAVTSRAEAQVMRMACIYALLDLSSVVRKEHLQAALAVWEYVEASAQFIFGNALGDPIADELLRALRGSPEGLTRTAISGLFSGHRASQQIGRALGVLVERGLVYSEDKGTGGRPAEVWRARGVPA